MTGRGRRYGRDRVRAGGLLALIVTIALVVVGFVTAAFSWPVLPTAVGALVIAIPLYVGAYVLASGGDEDR